MRIRQCRMNQDMRPAFSSFFKRYGLRPYENKKEPVVFFGLYHVDLRKVERHKSLLVLMWAGTDIILPGHLDLALASQVEIKHIAISSFIQEDLDKRGVKYKFLPLVGSDTSGLKSEILGNEVYTYIPSTRYEFYGGPLVDRLRNKCKYKINIIDSREKYSKEQLYKIYKRCFCGLRLTEHDGVANQVVEMGIMGRKTIYNGKTPSSIFWQKNVDDIMDKIYLEAKKIGTFQNDLSEQVRNFYNVGDDWLYTDYWKDI